MRKNIKNKEEPIRLSVNNKPYCRNKFHESLPKYNLENPCISFSSPYIGSEIQALRKKEIENKKYWITSKSFNLFSKP